MTATDVPSPTAPADGRRARAARSREAVVEAILDLINETGEVPAADEVAARAGVSVRSLFRYFDDLQSLHVAAVDRHVERVAPLFSPPPSSGSLDRRIDALVTARARLYEGIGPVRRVAESLRGRSEAIEGRLQEGRVELAAQVADQFEVELADVDGNARSEFMAALEMAASWPAWSAWRTDQQLTKAQAAGAMRRTLRSLLAER